jgi:hypothetical protein
MNKIVIVILCLFMATGVSAYMTTESFEDITVNRVLPESSYVGQKLWVLISLENNGTSEKEILFVEDLGNADFNESEAASVESYYGETFWSYEWEIVLDASENVTVGYWLVPNDVGDYIIPSAELTVNDETYFLDARTIRISCLMDGKCLNGENYVNCPGDCESGEADGVCDMLTDGKCDPDCEDDVDCVEEQIMTNESTSGIQEAREEFESSESPVADEGVDLFLPLVAILFVVVIVLAILLIKKKP